jgi:hypothetical protein
MTELWGQVITVLAALRMDEEAVLWSATSYQDDNGMVQGCTTEHGTRQFPRP